MNISPKMPPVTYRYKSIYLIHDLSAWILVEPPSMRTSHFSNNAFFLNALNKRKKTQKKTFCLFFKEVLFTARHADQGNYIALHSLCAALTKKEKCGLLSLATDIPSA